MKTHKNNRINYFVQKLFPLKSTFLLLFFCVLISCSEPNNSSHEKTITISGKVVDFDGNPIDSCAVKLLYNDFSTAYEAYSDTSGYYILSDVEKGKYLGLYAIRPKEYPTLNAVPDDDKRLEFWAWNVIADKDLTINPRYHRLELYGFNVFKIQGGYQGLFAYVRPMSIGKYLSHNKITDGNLLDISVDANSIEFKIFAGDELLQINLVQQIEEFVEQGVQYGYLLQFEYPKQTAEKYYMIRIEATHKLFGEEKGENIYFYEIPDFK